jgi:RNA polymerase sigma factor (sigma-70 family)
MASGPREGVHQGLDRVFHQGTVAGLAEGELLRQFAASGDEVAFEALVARHGPLVLGVCRRMLGDPHAAADAFQATFLVLVRKAGSLRHAEQLGPWLHSVAFRIAARARSDSARRRERERRGARSEVVEGTSAWNSNELRAILDEEIDRLPEKYRGPIVLCYLEGQTHEQAAARLACTPVVLRGRLDRARAKLRARLARRGVAPGVVLGAPPSGSEAIPAALKDATVAIARQATATSASVAALAGGVLRTMALARLKLVASLLAVGAILLAVVPYALTRDEKDAEVPKPARVPDGFTVMGRVLDREGRPIAGARVGQGSNRQEGPTPETTTDAEGRFAFRGVAPGPLILTVQASGHAPELKSVIAGPGLEPIEFRLGPGRTVTGRIVDLENKPIVGAPVSAGPWREHRSLVWHSVTDAEGRYRWEQAPEDDVLIDIGSLGYVGKRYVTATPPEKEYTVKMPRPRFVRGSVTDAGTGKPVEHFTVLTGYAGGGNDSAEWQYDFAQSQSGGTYEAKLGAEYRNFDRYLRIEAEGYLPAVSRAFKKDEAEWDRVQNFQLQRGAGTVRGIVHRPDGLTLGGADVVVEKPRMMPIIQNGQPPPSGLCRVVKSDSEGRFAFPLPEPPFGIIVLHAEGFAERSAEQLAATPDVTIAPWGRIEGIFRIGARPGAGEELSWVWQRSVHLNEWTFYSGTTKTDSSGRFAFERVMPGSVAVGRQVKSGQTFTVYPLSAPVEVAPGATAKVAVGGTGRPVIGRLSIPKKLSGKHEWTYHLFEPRLDGKQVRSYDGKPAADGSFRIEDVVAGTYDLIIEADDFQSNQPPYALRRGIIVPETPGGRSDESLDLGALDVELPEKR